MKTRDQIRQFIRSTFYVADSYRLDDDTSLLRTGIVDSTGMLEVIEFIESELGVAVDEREVLPENLETIGRIAAYVERKTRLLNGDRGGLPAAQGQKLQSPACGEVALV